MSEYHKQGGSPHGFVRLRAHKRCHKEVAIIFIGCLYIILVIGRDFVCLEGFHVGLDIFSFTFVV